MNKLILIFVISLILRIGAMILYPLPVIGDALEYYNNSIDLGITENHYNYSQWYERNPGCVLFLHVIHRNIYVQILISALTVLIAYNINPFIGWIYCFYPNHIVMSYLYQKETLLIFFIFLIIYYFKNRPFMCYTLSMLVLLPFQSFGGVLNYNLIKSQGYTWNIYKMWSPVFRPILRHSHLWNYILAMPYAVMMFTFFRRVKILSWQFFYVLSVSLCYAFTLGSPRFKEILFPAILITIFERRNNA